MAMRAHNVPVRELARRMGVRYDNYCMCECGRSIRCKEAKCCRMCRAEKPKELSTYQLRVVALIAQSKTRKEIALAFKISLKTIEHMCLDIRRKLGSGD